MYTHERTDRRCLGSEHSPSRNGHPRPMVLPHRRSGWYPRLENRLVMACEHHRYGTPFPDYNSLIRSHICLQVLISLPVYAFYARRIRVLGGRLWICFAVVILGLTHFTLAIVFSTKLIVNGDVSALASHSTLVGPRPHHTPRSTSHLK